MNKLMTFLKVMALILLSPFLLGGIGLIINKTYVLGCIMIIVSGIFLFLIIKSLNNKSVSDNVSTTSNQPQQDKCPICGIKLTLLNKGIGGRLKNGEKLCISCLNKVGKLDANIMQHSNSYTLDDVGHLLTPIVNESGKENMSFDSQIRSYIEANENFGDDGMHIKRCTIQILESLEIIENSPNPDTVIGRGNFVFEKLPELLIYAHDPRFLTGVQYGVDEYKSRYYDRVIPQRHLFILLTPVQTNAEFTNYYRECLIESCIRQIKKQEEQIVNLKQQKAINNRINKLESVYDEVLEELEVSSVECIANVLQQLKDQWYKEL